MNGKVLIVDDEKGIVIMLKNYFESHGYQVYTAFNGKEALEKISCQPDIVLLDINMPEMDGLTVCEHIRKHILLKTEYKQQIEDGSNESVIDGYSGFIFKSRYNTVLSPHGVNRVLVRIIKAYNSQEEQSAKREKKTGVASAL